MGDPDAEGSHRDRGLTASVQRAARRHGAELRLFANLRPVRHRRKRWLQRRGWRERGRRKRRQLRRGCRRADGRVQKNRRRVRGHRVARRNCRGGQQLALHQRLPEHSLGARDLAALRRSKVRVHGRQAHGRLGRGRDPPASLSLSGHRALRTAQTDRGRGGRGHGSPSLFPGTPCASTGSRAPRTTRRP
jgi:hypothetical protein